MTAGTARHYTKYAVASAAVQAAVTAWAIYDGKLGIDAWEIVDVAVLAGLGYGVYRTSRLCAAGLLVNEAANILYKAIAENISPGYFSLALMSFYLVGFIGAMSIPREGRQKES